MLNSTETILTYGELSPIFYAAMDDGLDTSGLQSAGRILKGCEPPIICQGHFHYEVFEDNENPEFLVRGSIIYMIILYLFEIYNRGSIS